MTRSRIRLFLTVFLVVFLGGVGVAGASALWSQQATVQAAVRTGVWLSPNFLWEPEIKVIDGGGLLYQDATFTWTAPPGASGTTRYYVDFTAISRPRPSVRERPENPITEPSMKVQTTRPTLLTSERFRVQFQAEVGSGGNAVRSAPVCRIYTMRGNFAGGGIEELGKTECP
jgi:predicted ribosomally synthesized peptide with SipW-like signal peptide